MGLKEERQRYSGGTGEESITRSIAITGIHQVKFLKSGEVAGSGM